MKGSLRKWPLWKIATDLEEKGDKDQRCSICTQRFTYSAQKEVKVRPLGRSVVLDLLKSSKMINHPLKHWAVKKSVERGNNSFIVLLHLDQPAEERSVDQAAMISPSRLLAPQRDLCSGRVQAWTVISSLLLLLSCIVTVLHCWLVAHLAAKFHCDLRRWQSHSSLIIKLFLRRMSTMP